VWDLTVQQDHDFYVVTRIGDLLVHNCDEATGTVFDRIVGTQAAEPGTVFPKSFNLTRSAGDDVWVAPNATRHIVEDTAHLPLSTRAVAQQVQLQGLADAVDNAVVGNWENMQVSNGWELIFSQARNGGVNPVLKHAQPLG